MPDPPPRELTAASTALASCDLHGAGCADPVRCARMRRGAVWSEDDGWCDATEEASEEAYDSLTRTVAARDGVTPAEVERRRAAERRRFAVHGNPIFGIPAPTGEGRENALAQAAWHRVRAAALRGPARSGRVRGHAPRRPPRRPGRRPVRRGVRRCRDPDSGPEGDPPRSPASAARGRRLVAARCRGGAG